MDLFCRAVIYIFIYFYYYFDKQTMRKKNRHGRKEHARALGTRSHDLRVTGILSSHIHNSILYTAVAVYALISCIISIHAHIV